MIQKSDTKAVHRTELSGVTLKGRGKVRDVYDVGDSLLLVATDRLSAFDYVLPNPIPDKGKVLNQISAFWFERFLALVPNHVISTDIAEFPEELRSQADQIAGRSTLAHKLEMMPVECVARGYLAGSGWKEYRRQGTVCGIELPAGLEESSRLPEPIFTPATKAEDGEHDENIPFSRVEEMVGAEMAATLRDKTLELYNAGADHALGCGIIIADTKFEFGMYEGELLLGDEVLTPDSSRFWPADRYQPGRSQPSFDKQYVRDYLESIGWNKQPPVPELPEEIVQGTRERYLEIYRILTGGDLA
jgi:phosphoribosylaminoimidazole-succinocarboxamide synthase